MTFKTKITLGFLAVLLLLLGTDAYSLYSLRRLDRAAASVLQDNFYSVQLGQQLGAALDQLAPVQQQLYLAPPAPAGAEATVQRSLRQFRRSLSREAGNLTEPGEREVVDSLTRAFGAYQQLLAANPAAPRTASVYFARVRPQHQLLRAQTGRMVQLNMAAIFRKNAASARTTAQVWRRTLALMAVSGLLGLYLLLSVPRSAVAPLRRLLASLHKANQQDFTSSIPAGGGDELGQVARAFNQLLEQLKDYRTSTVAQFKAERNRLAGVVNALDEGLLVVDENHRVIVANPVISRLLGVPAAQLTGRPAAELAAQSALFAQLLRHLEVPAAQRAPTTPLALPQAGGEAYYHLLLNEVTSFDDVTRKTELVGSVLTLRDVSEQRRLDQVKWRFLTSVSQELHTPLSLMQLSLQRLQDGKAGPLTPEQQNITYTLSRENKHLLKLVHELLDVSQLEQGTIQLNLQASRLHEIVQFVVATIRPQLQPKRLALEVQVPADLPLVRADIEKTTWVLLSLLANAIRYAHMQDTLRIGASLLPTGQHVQVRVQDQGPGIAPEMQEKIFRRFTQLPSQGGSGLGLSIAREFMASQGGQLGVESELGKGSTFLLTLLVSRADLAQDPRAGSTAAQSALLAG